MKASECEYLRQSVRVLPKEQLPLIIGMIGNSLLSNTLRMYQSVRFAKSVVSGIIAAATLDRLDH